jgi:uncharacterized protein YbbK (DUF523 family)
MKQNRILVSRCLLGENVRWDGKTLTDCPPILKEWKKAGLVIPICPEMFGGLPIPRQPAEPQGGDGREVVAGTAIVIDPSGKDVTAEFLKGAREALRLAEENGVTIAVLKALSPSCGSKQTYDGTFSNSLKPGMGVTAALLKQNGIQVHNENEIDQIVDLIG